MVWRVSFEDASGRRNESRLVPVIIESAADVRRILADPESDAYLHEVTASIIAGLEGSEPAKSIGIAAHEGFSRYVDGLIEARIESPGRDLISGIVRVRTSPEAEAVMANAATLTLSGRSAIR